MSFVGKNIKKIRKVNKLNQSQFADIFELSRSNIGSYEEERAEPKTDVLIKIAKKFSIPIEILITKEITLNDLTHFENSVHEKHRPQRQVTLYGNQIPFVPINQNKTYREQHKNKDFILSLNHLCLPLPENIRTRAFQLLTSEVLITKSNYHHDDIFIGSFVNKKYYQTIPQNQPYIIVTKERIVCSHLSIENASIVLKKNLEISSIKLDDVEEIWTLIGRYENTSSPNESITHRLNSIEQRLQDLETKIESTNK